MRAAHPAGRELPVKVLDLAEFDLHLDLVPVNGLREQLDIDALLMGDLKSILVDKRAFMSPRLEYRLRFSVAHEIGHLILHRDIYAGLRHATAAEWFDYISAIPEVEYGWVEWQAYEFAGRLLVPPDAVARSLSSRYPIRASRRLFRLAGCRRSRARLHRHAHRAQVRRLGGSDCETIARGKTLAAKLKRRCRRVEKSNWFIGTYAHGAVRPRLDAF